MLNYRYGTPMEPLPVSLWAGARAFGEIAKVAAVIDRIEARMRGTSTLCRIKEAVCQRFELSANDMVTARRHRDIARPRQIAMALACKLTPKSLVQIGRAFGNRDHTTVLHACRQVERLCAADPEFAEVVRELEGSLRDG